MVADAEGTITGLNGAACHLLESTPRARAGRSRRCWPGPGATRWRRYRPAAGRAGSRQKGEILLPAQGRDRHLSVTVVPLSGPPGSPAGAVAVVDDLTPVMRAQKVEAWGEVARKLAHEIKNPLTPIQLSAQRIRRAHFRNDPTSRRCCARARPPS